MFDDTFYLIRPDLKYHQINDDEGYLIGLSEYYRINNPIFNTVLSSLNQFGAAEGFTRLEKQHSLPELYYAYMKLSEHNYIIKTSDENKIFFNDSGTFSQKKFFVLSTSEEHHSDFTSALKNIGLKLITTKEKDCIVLVLCSNYLEPQTEEIITSCHAEGLSCYPIQVAGRHIQMGPALAPQQKPCFSCLKHALLQNRPLENFLNNHPKSTTNVSPGYHTVPILSSLALNIVSLQLAKEFSHTVSNNTLVSIDLFDLKREEHHVRTLPQCSTCGDPGIYTRQVQGVIKLKDVQRRNSSYGGFRLCTAEETWNNCRHLISPLTGIITHLHSRESRGSSLRHIWESSCSVNPQHNRRDKTESFIKKSYGKGQTFDQARVSAICETLERHAAVYQGSEPKILSSYDKMEKAIEPQTLLNFSDSQHRNRVHTDIIKEQVSDCYDHQGVLSWTPTWSLTENCTKYLPLSYCYSLAPSEENEILIPFSTIGNATGNCLEVAIIQGFLELVERDAAAIWWYNRLQRPEINLESFENPYFNALKQQYTELGWNIWCLDLTHDFEIPVIIAFAENDQGEFYGGLGCHFDLSLAVQRALTELNQLFSPHENHPPNFIKSDIETPLFLYPSQEIRHADFYPPHPYQSLKDDIYYCRDKVTELGMEMLVLNYSRPDINMSTAKVIVPGMRHFWKRLGPGRLYEVPLKLKWLDRCLTEPEMNTQVFPL